MFAVKAKPKRSTKYSRVEWASNTLWNPYASASAERLSVWLIALRLLVVVGLQVGDKPGSIQINWLAFPDCRWGSKQRVKIGIYTSLMTSSAVYATCY